MIDKNADSTTKAIFDVLAERQRHRSQTDLANLFRNILKMNPETKIEYPEYIQVFKKLEASDMGRLVKGRGRNPDRFIWKYNLKDLANKVKMNGISKLTAKQMDLVSESKIETPVKRSKIIKVGKLKTRRTGPGSRLNKAMASQPEAMNAAPQVETVGPINITIQLDPNMSQQDRVALIKLLTGK